MKHFHRSLIPVLLVFLVLCVLSVAAAEEEEEYEPQNIYEWGDPGYIDFLTEYAEDKERYSADGYRQLVELYDPWEPIPFSDLRYARRGGLGANG